MNSHSSNNNNNFDEKLRINILIRVLNQDENAIHLVKPEVIKYIEDKLSLDDRRALIHLLKEELEAFLDSNYESINLARKAKDDLLTLLRHNELNAGDSYTNPNYLNDRVNWGVVPKFKKFEGDENKAYSFIQSFAAAMKQASDKSKIQTFVTLLSGPVLIWFSKCCLTKWADIENEFIKT